MTWLRKMKRRPLSLCMGGLFFLNTASSLAGEHSGSGVLRAPEARGKACCEIKTRHDVPITRFFQGAENLLQGVPIQQGLHGLGEGMANMRKKARCAVKFCTQPLGDVLAGVKKSHAVTGTPVPGQHIFIAAIDADGQTCRVIEDSGTSAAEGVSHASLDGKGAIEDRINVQCFDTYIPKEKDEHEFSRKVIEMDKYLSEHFSQEYHILLANCGGFARMAMMCLGGDIGFAPNAGFGIGWSDREFYRKLPDGKIDRKHPVRGDDVCEEVKDNIHWVSNLDFKPVVERSASDKTDRDRAKARAVMVLSDRLRALDAMCRRRGGIYTYGRMTVTGWSKPSPPRGFGHPGYVGQARVKNAHCTPAR